MNREIHVVGAGLAGSECALRLAGSLGPKGFKIVLHEMRGTGTTTPAHRTDSCAELVCSNSFGSVAGHAAPGLLKWEAEVLGSKVLEAALDSRVPAGQALGIDRERFADRVTEMILAHPAIELRRELITSLDMVPRPAVIATGPLTHDSLARSIQDHFQSGEFLYFYDAIAPIVAADSIDTKVAWKADRWDRGTKDYWNCPLSKKEYYFFIEALREAKKIEPKEFELEGFRDDTPYFESCMPIEAILARGPMTLRFGPMSPKGLRDPRTGNNPFAVVQLRQDNREGTAFNMVGFQTKMAYGDQKSVFRLIPGLAEAEFLKLGSIHRNLYLNTPNLLNSDLSSKRDPWLFFAGQMTGVEGYFESTCMGWLVAHLLTIRIEQPNLEPLQMAAHLPPRESALGSLHHAITDESKVTHFQPTNINFGHLPEPPGFEWEKARAAGFKVDKTLKKDAQVRAAKSALLKWAETRGIACSLRRVEEAAQALTAPRSPAGSDRSSPRVGSSENCIFPTPD